MLTTAQFIEGVARKYADLRVDQTISPDDAMFSGDKDIYFRIGLTALHAIESALEAALIAQGDVRRILDFGCGHGRVLRVIRAAFPEAAITAGDILEPAAMFCARTFKATPLVTSDDFDSLSLADDPYDLIWLGSIFTHLNNDQFIALLRALKCGLTDRGILVFTTAGAFVSRLIRQGDSRGVGEAGAVAMLKAYDSSGFGYAPYVGWTRPWGRTIAKPSWVTAAIEEVGLQLVLYTERGWGGRQDVIAAHQWSS